ncbi:hypothetical protein BDZ89DRAFT_1200590 [Hymenopellis radicata]|nr:hypothetical protein BDZ89DRAFT_1200590 [Hymenopellis radicata]
MDEETDVQVVPCPRHVGKKSRPFFRVQKHANATRSRQVNDPFNYEHKYAEDPPYQEMGPYARLWKAFLEESAKVDADKVADWTDALDILLVFAGLFSAVVSTFLTQTFQKLEVDPNDIAVSLLYELCDLVRALNNNQSTDIIPRFKGSPASIFRPTRTATWVNGLWFVSLAISLTTALVAVVTKQWIHQYVASVNLGTPRERCRIRQFRYMNLQTWQVPLIIGLLPVLMHAALGLFLRALLLWSYRCIRESVLRHRVSSA